MFPSYYNIESTIPRVQSRHAQSGGRSMITLDFNREDAQQPRRSSFLPAAWNLEEEPVETSRDKYMSRSASLFYTSAQFKTTKHTVREFCTGSRYLGEYNKLGMSGKGIYKYPHGVIYDGYFNKKGEFHGSGSLVYPSGQRVEGIWRNGKLVKGASCVTSDNIPFATHYCRMPDRRFQIEVQGEMAPAGHEYLTNAPNPPRTIQKGCYDTGEGFYEPKLRIIFDYSDSNSTKPLSDLSNMEDLDQHDLYALIMQRTESQEFILSKLRQQKIARFPEILKIPTDIKERWILDNCRRAWEEPTGYRQDLYENFSADKLFVRRSTDDFNVEEEAIINQLAEHPALTSGKPSTLYSFTVPSHESQPKRGASLMVLSKMLLPKLAEGDRSEDQVKKPFAYQVKRKPRRSAKPSRKSTKNGKQELKHFYMTFLNKLKLKVKE